MLPALYHAHHSLHPEDLQFWMDLARRYGNPLLELGCGSGRLTMPLVRSGMRVVGLDKDPEMLRFLHRSVEEEPLTPTVFLADMCRFNLVPVFRLVILPCNTYSTLPPVRRLDALRSITHCLVPGGVFAASLPDPQLLSRLPEESEPEEEDEFSHPVTGNPVVVSSAWSRDADRLNFRWIYDHLLPDGRVERMDMHVSHYLTPQSVYLDELKAAGMQVLELLGDFDSSPHRRGSPHLIFIAQKTHR